MIKAKSNISYKSGLLDLENPLPVVGVIKWLFVMS